MSVNPSTAQVVKSDKVHMEGSPLPGQCRTRMYRTGLLPKFAVTVLITVDWLCPFFHSFSAGKRQHLIFNAPRYSPMTARS